MDKGKSKLAPLLSEKKFYLFQLAGRQSEEKKNELNVEYVKALWVMIK